MRGGSSSNYSRLRVGVAPTLAPGPLGHWHQFATISNKQTNFCTGADTILLFFAEFCLYLLKEEQKWLAEVDLLEQGAALQATELLLSLLLAVSNFSDTTKCQHHSTPLCLKTCLYFYLQKVIQFVICRYHSLKFVPV